MLAIALPLIPLLLTQSVRAASVVPSYNGWNSVGCYQDIVAARVLPHMEQISGGMTVEKCLDACHSSGYAFAGLEWSQECFCGPTLPPTPATDGRCDMPCQADSSEICGGGLGLTVYEYSGSLPSPPSNLATYKTWTYDNCYVDSIWNRALPNGRSVSGPMTIEKCLDACSDSGYQYAGLEYAGECYCGSAQPNQVANDGRCDMACSGNPSQLCGGGNGLSVYHSSSSANAPQPIDSYNGWSFSGCYKDSIHSRVLPQRAAPEHDYDQTIEICIDACSALGYVFAGLEYGSECWCGNWKPWDEATDGRCNMACVGNHQERCGGPNGIDVYQFHSQTTVVTDFTTTTAVVGTFTTATTIATVVEGTGSYAETITKTTDVVVPATYTTTLVAPLTITTTAVIPYTTTTTVIGGVTLTSTIATPVVGSTTVVVPFVGSTTQAIPLTGSTTVPVPLTGSTTTLFPVTASTTLFAPSTGTRTVPLTVGRTSFTLSIYTGTTSFVDPLTTVIQPVIILTTLAKTYTTTTGSPLPFTTSVPSVRPITLTGSDIKIFTTTSSAIQAFPTTSLAINTFPAVSSNVAAVTSTSTYYAPFTSETTGFVPVATSSVNVGSYTSSSVDIEPVPGSTTVVTEYTTTSVGYTPYTTTAYDTQVTTFVATVPTPITVTTTFITRVDDPQYTTAP